MFLSLSSFHDNKNHDYLGVTEHILSDHCADTFNESCLLEGSWRDYTSAYTKSNSQRPREWIKKVVLSTDTSVYASQCLIYSWPNACFLTGSALNWNARNCPVERPQNIANNSNLNDKYASISEGIIFQSRGFNVYGHWLLDYLPRLLLIQEYCKEFPDLPIIIRSIPRWAKDFILRLGIQNPIIRVPQGGEIHVKLLHIPLIMKEGSVYYEPSLAESFFKIQQKFTDIDASNSSSFPDKIYIARSKEPFAINQHEAIKFYAKYGFHCIYPELFSLKEQIEIFSRCRSFIGEDSSAMHNIGYASQSSSIIFSRMNRVNLWHAAVASATGQHIRPIQSTIVSDDGKYQVPLDSSLLDGL